MKMIDVWSKYHGNIDITRYKLQIYTHIAYYLNKNFDISIDTYFSDYEPIYDEIFKLFDKQKTLFTKPTSMTPKQLRAKVKSMSEMQISELIHQIKDFKKYIHINLSYFNEKVDVNYFNCIVHAVFIVTWIYIITVMIMNDNVRSHVIEKQICVLNSVFMIGFGGIIIATITYQYNKRVKKKDFNRYTKLNNSMMILDSIDKLDKLSLVNIQNSSDFKIRNIIDSISKVIHHYDACNNISLISRIKLNVPDLIVYGLICCITLAFTWATIYYIDPAKVINDLIRIRSIINDTNNGTIDFENVRSFINCASPGKTVMYLLQFIFGIAICMVMILYFHFTNSIHIPNSDQCIH